MNKLNISDSDKRLLLIFFAVLIFAGAYFFIFNPNMKKASVVKAENDQDKATVEQLQMMEKQLPAVKEQINDLKQKQEGIIEQYPADLTTEKIIWVLQDIQDHNDFQVTEASFLLNNQIGAADASAQQSTSSSDTSGTSSEASQDSTASGESTESQESTTDSAASGDTSSQNSADTALESTPQGCYATVTISYEASYEGLKNMIAYVNDYSDRITIAQSSSEFDKETGRLTGNMTLNMYYIKNTGKNYVVPDFGSVSKGVGDIFGGASGSNDND
ncbi:MAG: hypothetical protein MR462_11075 [Clostridiaceae bacterium]|nr:hypothetical protein [Clostridiaceae bacterium]